MPELKYGHYLCGLYEVRYSHLNHINWWSKEVDEVFNEADKYGRVDRMINNTRLQVICLS